MDILGPKPAGLRQAYTIYPLYFGNWTQDQIDTQQVFLQNLAAYISGENAPAGQQPTLWQYGPRTASVGLAVWVNKTTAPDQHKSTCGSPKDNQWRLCNLQESSSEWIDAIWHQPDGPHYSSTNFADNNPPTACNCSDELHIYQGTLTQYQADYKNLYAQGFRLYTLDPYVTSDGTVLYKAIWRSTRTYEEIPVYGETLTQLQQEITNTSSSGFYLYILSPYVLPGANGDTVLYDAVFRRGMFDRPL